MSTTTVMARRVALHASPAGDRLCPPTDHRRPDKPEGRPCTRGLRITLKPVVRLVAAGWSFEQILSAYPELEADDIRDALEYAAASTDVHCHSFQTPA
jgi:uncharacterized protein (DUF433 family)